MGYCELNFLILKCSKVSQSSHSPIPQGSLRSVTMQEWKTQCWLLRCLNYSNMTETLYNICSACLNVAGMGAGREGRVVVAERGIASDDRTRVSSQRGPSPEGVGEAKKQTGLTGTLTHRWAKCCSCYQGAPRRRDQERTL